MIRTTIKSRGNPALFYWGPVFLARISPHIPNKWEQTTRYFGYYSSRSRAKRKLKASKSWAALIKRVYEIDPLLCPKCSGSIKIIAFIVDPREVKALLQNLKIPAWTKPTPIQSTAPPTPKLIPFLDDIQFQE